MIIYYMQVDTMSIPISRQYSYDVCRLIIDRVTPWGVEHMDIRPPTLGEFVARRRRELGITSQSALAELAGLDTSVINRLEKNRDPEYNPQVDTLARLARALQVSLDELARYTSARAQVAPLPPVDADAAITARFDQMRQQARTLPGLTELERRRILADIDVAEARTREQAPNV